MLMRLRENWKCKNMTNVHEMQRQIIKNVKYPLWYIASETNVFNKNMSIYIIKNKNISLHK